MKQYYYGFFLNHLIDMSCILEGKSLVFSQVLLLGREYSMPMPAEDIIHLIKQGIPDADVQLKSLVADQDHYAAIVIASSFEGKTKIQQHQMVYKALQGRMGAELHALSLKTQVPHSA